MFRLPCKLVTAAGLAGLSLLLVGGPAQGAGWIPPRLLSEGPSADNPVVAIDARGDAFAAWINSNGAVDVVEASYRPADGEWQSAKELSSPAANAGNLKLAVDPAGEAVAVWAMNDSHVIAADIRPFDGEWQPAQTISPSGAKAANPDVAIAADGAATAVWESGHEAQEPVVEAASASSAGVWRQAQSVSAHPLAQTNETVTPQVGVDAAGNAVAIWHQPAAGIEGSSRAASAVDWGNGTKLSLPEEDVSEPALSVAGSGNMLAAWKELNSHGESTVVADDGSTSGGWIGPVALSQPSSEYPALHVAAASNGADIVAWQESKSAASAIETARRPPGGIWSQPLEASAPGRPAEKPSLSVDGSGNALVAWSRYESNKTEVIQTASLPITATAWQGEETLSEPAFEQERPELASNESGYALSAFSRETPGAPDTNQVLAVGYDSADPAFSEASIPSSGVAGQPIALSVNPFDVWAHFSRAAWTFGDGTTQQDDSLIHTYAKAGTYEITVTSSTELGPVGASGVITIVNPIIPPAPARVLSSLRQSASRWREGKQAPLVDGVAARRKPPLGTTFSFELNETTRVTFTFTHTSAGRRAGGRCVAPSAKNKRKPRCARTVTAGTLAFSARAGSDTVRFQGLISKHKRLAPGRYTLRAAAAGQKSPAAALRFTILG